MWGISHLAEDLLASSKGLCSIELVQFSLVVSVTLHFVQQAVMHA